MGNLGGLANALIGGVVVGAVVKLVVNEVKHRKGK